MKNIILDNSGQDSIEYIALSGFGLILALIVYGILKPKLDEVVKVMFS